MRRLLFVMCLMLLPTVCLAAKPSKIKGFSGTGEERIIELSPDGGTVIEGKLDRPKVFYVLARAQIAYTALELRQDFQARTLRDAFRRPF